MQHTKRNWKKWLLSPSTNSQNNSSCIPWDTVNVQSPTAHLTFKYITQQYLTHKRCCLQFSWLLSANVNLCSTRTCSACAAHRNKQIDVCILNKHTTSHKNSSHYFPAYCQHPVSNRKLILSPVLTTVNVLDQFRCPACKRHLSNSTCCSAVSPELQPGLQQYTHCRNWDITCPIHAW